MAKCTVEHGHTSVIRHVKALDASETDGSGKTGLAFGDMTAKYVKPLGTLTALTVETIASLGTYAAPTSNAHLRFKELSNADPTKGVYEIQFHNDWFASGEMFTLFLSATDMADLSLEIQIGPQDTNVVEVGGSTQSLTDLKDFADAGYDPATNKVQGVVLVDTVSASDAPTSATIADAIWDEAKSGHTAGGTFGEEVQAHALSSDTMAADLTKIHGTSLTETSGQLAGRFVDFFDQASAGYSVGTALSSFKATGFSTHSAANVWAASTRVLTASTNFNDPTATAVADAVLTRDWTAVSGEANRSALNALRPLRNKVSESSGVLTVCKENDSTTAWTATVTTNASADPVTGIDPD